MSVSTTISAAPVVDRDDVLGQFINEYATATGTITRHETKTVSGGEATFFTIEGVWVKCNFRKFKIDHMSLAVFPWNSGIDLTMIREGQRVEVFGLVRPYTRKCNGSRGYGIPRIASLRRVK